MKPLIADVVAAVVKIWIVSVDRRRRRRPTLITPATPATVEHMQWK